jgi:Zn-dependent protease
MLFLVRFGWGKPVQFDPFNLRHPRRDAALISVAGPTANILLALIVSLFLRVLPFLDPGVSSLIALFQTIIVFNVILAVFNLIPISPLDGFKIVGGLLPADQAKEWYQLERYGMIFLIFLVFPIFGGTAPISHIISPIINVILSVLLPQPMFI